MELLWLLTVFLVPLMFVGPGLMTNGFDVPKVTLYRSLVGLMSALWIIEIGLNPSAIGVGIPRLSPSLLRNWLLAQPGRWVLVAAWMLLASYLISTLLSPSISVSLWGSEPALDGNGFYNTLCHFLLFLVLATHLKRAAQLWRLLGAITASGVVVGLYAVLQYYGLDPFGIHVAGGRVVSSLGNTIFAGSFLLMVAPVTLVLALKSNGPTASLTRKIWWTIPLTIIVLGMAFTQARGPWIGLAAGLGAFLALIGMAMGWRASLRALLMSGAAIAVTWAIVTFIPAPAGRADLAPRAWSAVNAVISTLVAELQDHEALTAIPTNAGLPGREALSAIPISGELAGRDATPTSMESRLILWKSAAGMALHRPWFQPEDRPLPLSLHLFGYGPEFFPYLFPLIHPRELSHLNVGIVYYRVLAAHNNTLNRWVELGFFGLASYLVLLGAVATIGIRVIRDRGTTTQVNQRLAMAAVLASVAGRTVEQLAGIPHLSDEALFWTLLAVVAALPMLAQEELQGEASSRRVQNSFGPPQTTAPRFRAPVLQVSLALVLASVVLGFTLVKNTNYALAENRATSATASLADGQPEMAMQTIDGAIALAPDVGRYHVIRANILDQARSSTAAASDQARLALEAYRANGRAVIANPFDIYGRFHFAESALTLGTLGYPGKGEEAIEEYRRLTLMLPRFWLSHFLLGRAYVEMGEPDRAVEAYSEAIRLDPLSPSFYDRRAEAHVMLGEYSLAVEDYDRAMQLSQGNVSYYHRRGVALFALGRFLEAIQDFDEAIPRYTQIIKELLEYQGKDEAVKWNPILALAYNNRGSAYYQLGRIERAIEDYDRAIQLSPRSAEFYANRAFAHELLNKVAEARRDYDRAIQLGFDPAPPESDLVIPKNQ